MIDIQDKSEKNLSWLEINLGYSTFVAFNSFSCSVLNFTRPLSSSHNYDGLFALDLVDILPFPYFLLSSNWPLKYWLYLRNVSCFFSIQLPSLSNVKKLLK